jgi:hypothetical protein
MRVAAFLIVMGACVPDLDPIGEQAWRLTLDREPTSMRGGPAGHVALVNDEHVAMIAPDGVPMWETISRGLVIGVVVDETGGAVVLSRAGSNVFTSRLSRFAMDGTLRWIVERPEDLRIGATRIVRDIEDATWVVSPALAPAFPIWARYDPAGTLVGSGELAFRGAPKPEPTGEALPDGGIAIPNDSGGITAIDPQGTYRWSVGIGLPETTGFVVHEDGELTLRKGRTTVVRFDAEHQERWRRELGGGTGITGLTDGAVVLDDIDGLGDSADISTLVRIDRVGRVSREIFRAENEATVVVAAPPRPDVTILIRHFGLDSSPSELCRRVNVR